MAKHPILGSGQIDQYLIDTYTTKSVDEQAAHLGLRRHTILKRRSKLIKEGRLNQEQRRDRRAWSDDDRQTMREMFQAGASVHQVAKAINRSVPSVYSYIENHMEGILDIRQNGLRTFTARQAATLLGINSQTFYSWINAGIIQCSRSKKPRPRTRKRNYFYLLHEVDLWEWMQRRETWMLWHPDHIVDTRIRADAYELRQGTGHWMTVGEVAKARAYTTPVVQGWIISGHLPAFRWGERSPYYVWSEDIEHFVPPKGIWTGPNAPGRYRKQPHNSKEAAA